MNDPRLLSIISAVFAIMGTYNLYSGSRKIRDARRVGQYMRWYKQTNFLTGIEYIILTFVFLLSIANRQGEIAPNMRSLIVPLYIILLIAAAVIAGLVIRQGISNVRKGRVQSQVTANEVIAPISQDDSRVTRRDMEAQVRRQRERRKNAAFARRRRAGRA